MGRLCYNMAGKTAKGRNEKMIRLVTCDIDGTLLHGEETSIDTETLEEIRRLREKIEENPASPKYILTRRGVGYYFAV